MTPLEKYLYEKMSDEEKREDEKRLARMGASRCFRCKQVVALGPSFDDHVFFCKRKPS